MFLLLIRLYLLSAINRLQAPPHYQIAFTVSPINPIYILLISFPLLLFFLEQIETYTSPHIPLLLPLSRATINLHC